MNLQNGGYLFVHWKHLQIGLEHEPINKSNNGE